MKGAERLGRGTECLDTLHDILLKYRLSHKIILCGDFNGTLLEARNYNKHDQLLHRFVAEHNLFFKVMKEHTFKHHSGLSSSQIDYFMSTHQNVIQRYQIGGRDGENSSSHVKVSCYLNIDIPDNSVLPNKQTSHSVRKLQWDRINQTQYEIMLETEIKYQRSSDLSVNVRLGQLTASLHKAAEAAVPSKIIKLKGPTWKASPIVRVLLTDCKEKYKHWIESGRTDPTLRSENIQAKRNLRKQLRKEKFNDRRTFYETLMLEPSTEMFYKLLRRNKGSPGHQTIVRL